MQVLYQSLSLFPGESSIKLKTAAAKEDKKNLKVAGLKIL